MAVSFLAHEVSDLCLGKPALRSLPITATVADALFALKNSGDSCVSVWSCNFNHPLKKEGEEECQCVGKVSMVDIICFLCNEHNILSPCAALDSSVSVLLPKIPLPVTHVLPSCSLLDAIDLILKGAQNLVVPIRSRFGIKRKQSIGSTVHGHREFCWINQEDIIRFLLSSIGSFSTIATISIDNLGIISTNILTIEYHSPASSAIEAISTSLAEQTSIAVTDSNGILIGEISPNTLSCCDETVAAAITTLSAGDLMAYIDCGGPPEDLVRLVKTRLKERNLEGMLEEFSMSLSLPLSSSSSSSDEECLPSPTTTLTRRHSRSSSYSARMVRWAEAIVCHPKSSLVAVMIQAIAHRVNYVWVIDDECSLIGIVTFSSMLKIFRENLVHGVEEVEGW